MSLPTLIEGLLRPDAYPHPVDRVRLIETHISWVLLAGNYAYKVKKPVDLGFLDFSTLEKRRACCEEEVRLNARLAPDIYLDVVSVGGRIEAPRVEGDGAPLEWAVRMRAFPADATLDRAGADISPDQIDAIADRIARFHKTIDSAPGTSTFGTPESVMHPVRENFAQMRALFPGLDATRERVERLAAWSEAEGERLQAYFDQRRQAGFVRDCHGDLHLGNIAWVGDAPLIFDCIEFNPSLRFVDIVSEVAFLFMDLVSRGQAPLAWRFLNRWLEHTGDYAGLEALSFYLSYRAMVRAKVAAIRASQGDPGHAAEVDRYLDLAWTLVQARQPMLVLMHGYSGSGKTWLSQQILEAMGAIRLRSDVERKRLFGLDALEDSGSVPGGIYTQAAGQRTFDRLESLAGALIGMNFTTIVDATFLDIATRQKFRALAESQKCPFSVVSIEVDTELLRARIDERNRQKTDASEADLGVLEAQMENADPFEETELPDLIRYGAETCPNFDALMRLLKIKLSSSSL